MWGKGRGRGRQERRDLTQKSLQLGEGGDEKEKRQT